MFAAKRVIEALLPIVRTSKTLVQSPIPTPPLVRIYHTLIWTSIYNYVFNLKCKSLQCLLCLKHILIRLATPSLTGSTSQSAITETRISKHKCLKRVLTQQPKQENGHLAATLV